LDNNVIVTPKLCLEIHYSDYIYFCGPLRHQWCWSFENHHSSQKLDVEIKSRNLGITSFNHNFLFTELKYNIILFQNFIKKIENIFEYKILKIDKKIIHKNSVIEMDDNKIAFITNIYKLPNDKVVLKIYLLDVILDDLGIFLFINKIDKNSNLIDLSRLKAIYTVEKKNGKTILFNKVYLVK